MSVSLFMSPSPSTSSSRGCACALLLIAMIVSAVLAPSTLSPAALSPARALDASAIVTPGVLPRRWISGGPDCSKQPPFHVHVYNSNLYILRESGCLHAEKPFLYLLFGAQRALLLDTGAGGEQGVSETPDVVGAVKQAMTLWAARTHKAPLPLLVGHLHSHGDHTFGDSQFAELPGTTLVPPNDVAALQAVFGIAHWPTDIGSIDLGKRVLDIVPIPGHDETSIAVYDRTTGVLLTGDTLYPGRIYINSDAEQFAQSIQRLVTFTQDKLVTHVLGTHIEQKAPYTDYPIGTHYAPVEVDLELSYGQLLELLEATKNRRDGKIVQRAYRDFSVCGAYPECHPVNL
jgi:hydroxyacylglutathione hydrolase